MKPEKESRLDRIEKNIEALLSGIIELKNAQLKTDEQQKRTDEQILELKNAQLKTDVKLNEIGRQLGELGLVQGEVAEDLFYRNVRYAFKERDIIFSDIKRNVKKKGVGEFDIVATNGKDALVLEVKNKLQKRMVDKFVNKTLPSFLKAFPQYKKYRILGGIGALVVKDDVGRYAQKSGLYVLTQTSDGGAQIINPKNFKAKRFS